MRYLIFKTLLRYLPFKTLLRYLTFKDTFSAAISFVRSKTFWKVKILQELVKKCNIWVGYCPVKLAFSFNSPNHSSHLKQKENLINFSWSDSNLTSSYYQNCYLPVKDISYMQGMWNEHVIGAWNCNVPTDGPTDTRVMGKLHFQ